MSETIGSRIKQLREDKGWSLRELEDRVGINYSVLNRIELDKRPVKDHEISKFADIFSVTSDYLVGQNKKYPEEIIDDPQLGLWYNKGKKSSAANRQRALEFLEFLEREEKGRKPGDKQ
jgi:transcriptional regulator with XRE-family HTH domain